LIEAARNWSGGPKTCRSDFSTPFLHYSNDHTNVYFALFHLKIVLLFERDRIFRRWNEAKTKFCIKINLKEGVAC